MDQAKKLREMMKNINDPFEGREEENKTSQGMDKKIKKAKVFSISSGKGGVGKTNFSINFAIALKKLGHEVVILDADIGLSNVEILSGSDIKYSISDIIFSGKKVVDVLNEGPEGIKIISGGSGLKELTMLNEEHFSKIIRSLDELQLIFDYIIIDTGAGISSGVIDFILASDEVMVITTPDPTSVMDAYVLIKSLNMNNYRGEINVVSNFVRNKTEGFNVFNKLDRAAEQFLKIKINYLGYILEDRAVSIAVRNQLPFIIGNPNRTISKQITNMAIEKSNSNSEKEKTDSFGQKLLNLFFKNK